MNLVRVNPLRELQDIQSTMNRFFSDTVARFFEDTERSFTGGRWAPPVNIYEDDNQLVFTCELPGFEKDDINISINDGRLIISGERKFEEEKNRNYHLIERWYGNFYRSFLLPTSVDESRISANLKNGVLHITLPKKEEARPKQIEVQVQ